MSAPVVMAPYDPDWPALYEAEAQRIADVAAPWIVAIEHIGSTAVEGLAAKPIIDIMVGLAGKAAALESLSSLRSLGYTVSDPEEEDWHFVLSRKSAGSDPGYHVHLMTHRSWSWRRHLLFRDYLRAHPQAARKYQRLKLSLARKYRDDRPAYTGAKTAFIEKIQDAARRD